MNKEEFLEKELHANNEAVAHSKLSDMVNPQSSFYVDPESKSKSTNTQQSQRSEVAKENIPVLRTFTGDMGTAVDESHLSLSQIVTTEATQKHNEPEKEILPKNKKSPLVILSFILSTMFLLGGAVAVGYVFWQKNQPVETTLTDKTVQPEILQSDEEQIIELKNPSARTIAEKITQELKNPSATDGLRKISFVSVNDLEKKPIQLNDLVRILELHIPDDLSRSMKQEYFLGINFIRGEGKIVFILKNESPEQLFPGMLLWEPYLKQDFEPFFQNMNTSTSTVTFKDKIIENKDTRLLQTTENETLFFYSIIHDIFVVFTLDENTFSEITTRIRENKN